MAFSAVAVLGLVLALGLILGAGMAPVLLIPIFLVVGGLGVAMWMAGGLRAKRMRSGHGPSGVPSTRDASFNPQQQP